MVSQLSAAALREGSSHSVSARQLNAALLGHLQEEQVGDLLDVVAVVDALMAKGVAEAPESLDDIVVMPRPPH